MRLQTHPPVQVSTTYSFDLVIPAILAILTILTLRLDGASRRLPTPQVHEP